MAIYSQNLLWKFWKALLYKIGNTHHSFGDWHGNVKTGVFTFHTFRISKLGKYTESRFWRIFMNDLSNNKTAAGNGFAYCVWNIKKRKNCSTKLNQFCCTVKPNISNVTKNMNQRLLILTPTYRKLTNRRHRYFNRKCV